MWSLCSYEQFPRSAYATDWHDLGRTTWDSEFSSWDELVRLHEEGKESHKEDAEKVCMVTYKSEGNIPALLGTRWASITSVKATLSQSSVGQHLDEISCNARSTTMLKGIMTDDEISGSRVTRDPEVGLSVLVDSASWKSNALQAKEIQSLWCPGSNLPSLTHLHMYWHSQNMQEMYPSDRSLRCM